MAERPAKPVTPADPPQTLTGASGRRLSTDGQRWEIVERFDGFGIRDLREMKATAAKLLMLDMITDLREITYDDAEELIAELIRARAAGRISRE